MRNWIELCETAYFDGYKEEMISLINENIDEFRECAYDYVSQFMMFNEEGEHIVPFYKNCQCFGFKYFLQQTLENRNFWVYTHTTPDGFVYVGQSQFETTNLRWIESHYRPNTTFGKAIRQWGWDNIQHKVIKTGLTHEEALAAEGDMIEFCKMNGVSLNERSSGNKWFGTARYEYYFKNKDSYLKKQRIRHNIKRGNEELKEKGYIKLF